VHTRDAILTVDVSRTDDDRRVAPRVLDPPIGPSVALGPGVSTVRGVGADPGRILEFVCIPTPSSSLIETTAPVSTHGAVLATTVTL
jgi:hypothetical protein